jgi:predicted DNA-binding WGR domain protein
MNRYFEYISDVHYKFWRTWDEGTTVFVHFGRIGTKGQIQVKSFPSTKAAREHMCKLLYEKERKGYVERPAGAVPQAKAPTAISNTSKKAKAMVPPTPVPLVYTSKRRRAINLPRED